MSTTVDAIPELDRAGLRRFALSTGGIIAALFGLVFPWVLERAYPLWPWLIGGGLVAWGVIAPGSLRPVYRAWMRFGLSMNQVMNPLILGLVYFAVITPIALFFRLIGRDTMMRKFDRGTASYRVPSNRRTKDHLEKPF